MGTHYKTLDQKCQKCGTNILQVSMKSPHIDDFAEECPTCEPGEALGRLNSSARSSARREEEEL